MSVADDSPFGKALYRGVADAPQLAEGVVVKLASALTELGQLACPVGTHASQGVKWRMLAMRSQLSQLEWQALLLWLEEAYGEQMVARAMKEFSVTSLASANESTPPPTLPPGAAAAAAEASPLSTALSGICDSNPEQIRQAP